MENPAALPKAKIDRKPRIAWVWVVPIFALGFVGWLIARNYLQHGPRITIRFTQAQSLEPGKSPVRYRGATIGLVTDLRLTPEMDAIEVKVELIKSAKSLARDGASFWIVQPEVTAEKIRGLRAIVSGDYIEVKPGTGHETNYFLGLDESPVLTQDRPGLQVQLLNPKVGSIQRGSAIYYRGVQVGEVTGFQLTPDAQAVTISAQIEERYAGLIRDNSRFWNVGGIQMDLGFRGANFRAESMKTLVSGGIAFATPDPPGKRVKQDAVFRLYDKGEEEWEKWAPPFELPPPATAQPPAPRSRKTNEAK